MNVRGLKRHLPAHIEATRGRAGHIKVQSAKLSYELDKARFHNAAEMAAFAASKIPTVSIRR